MSNEKISYPETTCAVEQLRVIPGKIDQLNGQNELLNVDVTRQLHGILDRLSSIGERLCQLQHPNNVPRETSAKMQNNDTQELPPSVGGILGALNGTIDEKARFLNTWQKEIEPEFEKYLSYIERHI